MILIAINYSLSELSVKQNLLAYVIKTLSSNLRLLFQTTAFF